MERSLKIALVPERRDVSNAKTRPGLFGARHAVANKERILPFIKEHFGDEFTSFTDLEWLNDEGLLYAGDDAEAVAAYLKKEEVDALFIINCNFGNEDVVGRLCRMMGLPVLLWGPRDEPFDADGVRKTDTQCGLFAISNQLRRYHVPFSYIENCAPEDAAFTEGVERFLGVVSAVKTFKNMRIVQVGTRLDPFKSVMANELELTEKFGFNLMTVNLVQVGKRFERILAEEQPALDALLADAKKVYDLAGCTDEALKRMLAFVLVYKEIADETHATVLSTECWTAIPAGFGVSPCFAMSILADMGYLVTCESDVHGAVTQAILYALTRGKTPPLFGEFTVRHPYDDNAEMLWHCGPFPASQKADGETPRLVAEKPSFRAADGRYTIARFQGDEGRYTLFCGAFDTTDGPKTNGTYLFAKFKDLPKLERKLVEGPYIHHMSEVRGDYTAHLRDLCRYIPGLVLDEAE